MHGEFVEFLLGHVPRAGGVRDWPEAHPYILAHLATHAAAAGKLGELVTDPGYLAYAARSRCSPGSPRSEIRARGSPASPIDGRCTNCGATTWPTGCPTWNWRRNGLAQKPSWNASRPTRCSGAGPSRWNQWPPDHPHRVLAGHHGPVREVTGLAATDQTARAASVGDDGTLRLWDVESAEQLGVHEVGDEALAAIDVVELPGPKQVAVVLSAAGFLTAHELPSMSRELNIPVRSGLRGWLNSMQLAAPEMRCVRLPDGRWAAVTGGPGMVTTIWDIRMGTPIVRLQTGLRPARLEFRKLASGVPVVVSIDPRVGAEHIFDLATGRHLPTGQSLLIAAEFTYYCRPDGTPIIGLRDANGLFSRDASTLFDLTGPEGDPVRAVKLGGHSNIRLMDGSILEADYSSLARYWRIESVPGQEPVSR